MTRKPGSACLFAFLGIWLTAAVAPGQQPATQPAKNPPPAAQNPSQVAPPPQQVPDESSMPEEDENVPSDKFVLNPLESDRNVKVGNYYWHKGKYRAALERYERATKFNPSSAEAFFKVAEAEEKLKNRDAARLAYQKVLDLAPDSKLAHEAKKKLESKS